MKTRLFLFALVISAISLISVISSAQRRPESETPIKGDFKITIKQTTAGQPIQSTTMIRGLRERSETSINAGAFNMNTVNITQCDLRRTIQVNDRARKYLITPMDSDDSSGDARDVTGAPASSEPSRRGGLVRMIVNTVDTGERKEMFGFTARHLKRTMMSQSSPDACNQQQMKIDTDGWYINLEYGLSCPATRPPQGPRTNMTGGCRDRYQFKRTGPTNLGYPLIETTTMYGSGGSTTFTMTKEVVELSRQTLDAALFDVPAGYTEARSQQEMSAAPSMAEIMAMSRQQSGQTNESGQSSMSGVPATANASARVRVGVVEFNNKTKSSASTDALRDQLIATLNNEGIDAVALNASSASEATVEAQAKQCAYILFTDISTLKAPSSGKKVGGLLGRATGIGSGEAGKAEVRFDFRLVATGSSSPMLQSSATAREETQEATLTAAIQNEASAVAGAVPRP